MIIIRNEMIILKIKTAPLRLGELARPFIFPPLVATAFMVVL